MELGGRGVDFAPPLSPPPLPDASLEASPAPSPPLTLFLGRAISRPSGAF